MTFFSMTSLLMSWVALGIFFLIIEAVTSTFYGLSLALSAFVVAIIVWITGEVTPSILQGVVFCIVALVTGYAFPKILAKTTKETPQWLDIYIGTRRKVKKIGDDLKISLDGVDYLVEGRDIKAGDTVKAIGRNGSLFNVEIV